MDFKATIFVNPEFVDQRSAQRKSLFDYWDNKASLAEIDNFGFLNWEEMRIMGRTGIIDPISYCYTYKVFRI